MVDNTNNAFNPDQLAVLEDFVEEAPSDPNIAYGRKEEDWVQVLEDAPRDGTIYGRQNGDWVEAGAGVETDYGIGLSLDDPTDPADPQVVNLQPLGPTPNLLGGAWVSPRTIDQGLEIEFGAPADGQLKAPRATDLLAGSFIEPPQDGLPYARKFDTTTLPGKWIWEPTVAAGLQITGLIPDNVVIPSTTPVAVTAYGAEFTPTCVIRIDGVDVVPKAVYVSPTVMTFTIDPTPELVGRTVTVTVHDPVAVPPALVDGMGAEPFEFQELVESLYRGVWLPATNVPDIVTLTKEDQWMWVANTATATIPELPPVAIPGLVGPVTEGDHIVWDATTATFIRITSPGDLNALVNAGTGLEKVGRTINLQPPGADSTNPLHIGGVRVPDRSDDQGLMLTGDGLLTAPLATPRNAGVLLEPEDDGKGYVRTTLNGVSAWVPPADTPLPDFGIGLSLDDTTDPDIVNLQPAGDSPATLGGVYVIDRERNEKEGLELGIDGRLRAPLATDTLAGTIVEPPPDDKGYVRRRDLAGVSAWVPPADTPLPDFGLGLSLDDTTPPGIVHLTPAGVTPQLLGGVYVPTRTAEQAADVDTNGGDGRLVVLTATDVLLGGMLEPPKDGLPYERVWNELTQQWEWKLAAVIPDFGIGLTLDDAADPDVVHLQPAGDSPATLGGVYVIDRERNVSEGLELGIDGRLRAPLATPRLAGTIVEPEDDGKGYVRTTLNGVSAWVPPADTPLPDFGIGLSLDDTTDPDIVHLQPAADSPAGLGGVYVVDRTRTAVQGLELNGDGELKAPLATDLLAGTHTEPAPNGIAHNRQWDVATSKWIWTPALTAGLTITGILPDKAIFGPNEPLLTVHAYGTDFTATCVIMVDGVDTATTFVSATELTFVLNPKVPIAEQSHIITVKDTAPVPPATGVGAGAEGFDFIVASTQVDYGTGLSFDTATTPPIVHLQPAGPAANLLGGVWVPPRTATQGLELYPGADPLLLGQVIAPVATDLLAGSIVEPPPDDKKYSRTRTAAGVSSWVEGADVDIAGNAPPEVGVIYVTARNKTSQGLNLNPDGGLYAPPATHEHLGTIVEPLNDGKQYARKTENGDSTWVETKSAEIAGNTAAEVGVIFVPDNRGLNLGADGSLSLRPAGEYPNLGGIFEPPILPADKTYVRKTGQWVEALQSAGVLVSDTPPVPTPPATSHPQGTMWWESDTGDLYVWYIDVDTGQWVQVNGESAPPTIMVSDDPPQSPTENQLWWDSNKGTLNLWYTDVDTAQWVEVAAPQKPGVPEAPIDGVPYARRDANWVATTSLAATPGDVKSGFQVNDHGGWIILNGRLVNTLTSTQQAQAALLGFTANLPNATGTVPLQNGSALGLVAGNMAKTIAQANLPAVNLTANNSAAANTGNYDFAAVNTNNWTGAGIETFPSNTKRGKSATGNTGYYYLDAEATHDINFSHGHTVDLPAHNHTIPVHNHVVPLGGSGTPLDTTPKSMSVNYFVFLGA